MKLERSEGQNEGTVVVNGYIGQTRHRVKISLEGDNYRIAIRAHEAREPIIASGQMVREKQTWWLREPVTIRLPLGNEQNS